MIDELNDFESKLLSEPPPKAKRSRKKRIYTCPWQIDDVYALPVTKDAYDALPYIMIHTVRPYNELSHLSKYIERYSAEERYYTVAGDVVPFYKHIFKGDSVDEIPDSLIYVGNFPEIKSPIKANTYLKDMNIGDTVGVIGDLLKNI